MTQEQYNRIRCASFVMSRAGNTEFQESVCALLDAFEALYLAADEALADYDNDQELSACLYDSNGDQRLRVRRP
jgi:hypothetical protein